MRPGLQQPEFGVAYRSGPLAWTDLHAGGLGFCVVFEEILRFSEDGIVSRHFNILDASRAIGRPEVAYLRRTAGATRYILNDRGYLEFEFSDAKYTGFVCQEAVGLLAFHVYHKESSLSGERVFQRQAADLGGVFFEELWRSIDETRGVAELRRYLAGGDVNARHPDNGWSLLHLACEHQNLGLIPALVESGADLEARDSFGQAPLHRAVDIDIDAVVQSEGELADMTFETTRLLLSLGADAHAKDGQGRTPRDCAAAYGEAVLEQFDRLIQRGSGPPPSS